MYWAAEPLFCRKALKEEVSVSYGYKDLYSGKDRDHYCYNSGPAIFITTRNINSGGVHIIEESFYNSQERLWIIDFRFRDL